LTLRIAIVLGPFHAPPPAGYGAVEKVWWQLAGAFARAGHAVHVVAKGRGAGASPPEFGVTWMRGASATGHIPVDLAKDLAYALRAARALPACDVVVSNSFWLPVALRTQDRRTGRLVVHVGRFPKGQMRLYRNADLVHTVSIPVADAIRAECPALGARIAVLGYPVDVATFAAAHGREPRARELLYVGRIHPEKGLHMLLDAFRLALARLPDATLALVGPSDERAGGGGTSYLATLRESARGLPVAIEPPIPDESRLALRYRQARAFCYPSLAERGETFGRSVLEAMAAGLPCIVSNLACFADFMENGREGLVFDHRAPDAAGRLADAIARVLSDAPFGEAAARQARERAAGYAFERMVPRYLAMLEAVAARGAA
jgi:glycosyltransferase involved in cell wall biosynthesis